MFVECNSHNVRFISSFRKAQDKRSDFITISCCFSSSFLRLCRSPFPSFLGKTSSEFLNLFHTIPIVGLCLCLQSLFTNVFAKSVTLSDSALFISYFSHTISIFMLTFGIHHSLLAVTDIVCIL